MNTTSNAKKRALLVDDEPVMVMIIHRLLTAAGYQVEMADDGVKALAKYEPDKYNVVITDFLMPSMDGLELAQTIKTLWPAQPIMLVTGFADRLKQERRSRLPVDRLLEKPFTSEGFSEALAELVPGG
jgi:CheY-like chemotaxis protein